jgi:hypothetical protein
VEHPSKSKTEFLVDLSSLTSGSDHRSHGSSANGLSQNGDPSNAIVKEILKAAAVKNAVVSVTEGMKRSVR